jgi:hypothetical protein
MFLEIQVALLCVFFILSNSFIIFFGTKYFQLMYRKIFLFSAIINIFTLTFIIFTYLFSDFETIFLINNQEKVVVDLLLSPFSVVFLFSFPSPFIIYRRTHEWEKKVLKESSFLVSLLYFVGFALNLVIIVLKSFSINFSFSESVSLFDILIVLRLITLLEACFYTVIFGQKSHKLEILISGIFYFCFFATPVLFFFRG